MKRINNENGTKLMRNVGRLILQDLNIGILAYIAVWVLARIEDNDNIKPFSVIWMVCSAFGLGFMIGWAVRDFRAFIGLTFSNDDKEERDA